MEKINWDWLIGLLCVIGMFLPGVILSFVDYSRHHYPDGDERPVIWGCVGSEPTEMTGDTPGGWTRVDENVWEKVIDPAGRKWRNENGKWVVRED